MTITLRWAAVIAVIAAAVVGRWVGWGLTLSCLGLWLDISGAVSLSWGVLKLHAGEGARRGWTLFPDSVTWRDPVPLLVRWFGEPFLSPVPATREDLLDTFSGLVLGFLGQAAGLLVMTLGGAGCLR